LFLKNTNIYKTDSLFTKRKRKANLLHMVLYSLLGKIKGTNV